MNTNLSKFITFFLVSLSIVAQNEQTIEFKNSKLHLVTYGKGEPLLIINGGPGMSSEGFSSLAKELAHHHLVITYDQRGTGKSTMDIINSETMTMDLMVEDIETLRKHLEFDNWIILGHSFGGMLASYYTSKHSDKVKGLILSSSGGIDLDLLSSLDITSALSQKERDSLNYWTNRISNGDSSQYAALKRGTFLAPAYLYDKTFVPIIAERLTQGNRNINGLIWENMRAINFDCKEELKYFDKPVLIIQGKQDIIGDDIAEKAHKIFPKSELIFIDKCAHYGWLEQPEIYFWQLNAFLAGLD